MSTTSIEERTDDADPPADTRRRRRTTAAIVAVTVVAVLAGGWWWFAGAQRSLVTIGFDALPIECVSGNVAVEDLEWDDDPFYTTVVDATADMECVLRVHVANHGRFTARVHELEIPFYGPGTGAAIHARGMSPLGVEPLAEDREMGMGLARDAIYELDLAIEPGERQLMTFQLRHAPDGCMSPDSTMSSDEAVILHASVLGRSGESTTRGRSFAQRGTEDSSCDT